MQSLDFNPQKRQHNEAPSCVAEGEPAAKKRKTFASGYSPEFWDTLSVVKLTRRALKEFDQRTASSSFGHPVPWKKNQENPSRRILRSTTKRIQEVVKQGGPDLSGLRGYATMLRSSTSKTRSSESSRKRSAGSTSKNKQTGRTKTTSPYSAEFEQNMIDLGVYPEGYRMGDQLTPEPTNIKELQQMLSRSRASLSPSLFSEGDFENFKDLNRKATSETKAISRVFPIIAGSKDGQFESAENIPFNRLKKFEADLTTPKPDIYYGAQPSQINRQVRRDLQASIVPSSRQNLPTAPNFFVEGKSADGRADVAQRQAMYDGALGARAIHQLQNYGSETTEYDGNAYTLSSTYHPGTGTLQIYATHPMESSSSLGETEYYMTQIGAYAMTHSQDTFIAGTTAFRNGREWAREQRDIHITSANLAAQAISSITTDNSSKGKTLSVPTANEEDGESETSLDELTLPDPPKRQRPSTNSLAPGSRRASSSKFTAS